MTVFVDTAILMYASRAEHPLRAPSVEVLERIERGELDGVISVGVVQEIAHRFLSLRRPDLARDRAIDALDLFAPVLPITHTLMRRVPDLVAAYPGLPARDLVHVATCIHEGIGEIISPDRAFDAVAEVRRIDPTAFTAKPA